MITSDQLVQLGASQVNAEKYLDGLNEAMDTFNINTPQRISQFLAQVFAESGSLSEIQENLNYSAQRLMQVWPARFPNLQIANQYAHNPQALAIKTYGGRGGNSAAPSEDGWLFSGKGLIQITFKSNYQRCGEALGIDLVSQPDLLLDPRFAALSAGWYWNNGSGTDLNVYADMDNDQGFDTITRKINGALGNIDQRCALWDKAREIFV